MFCNADSQPSISRLLPWTSDGWARCGVDLECGLAEYRHDWLIGREGEGEKRESVYVYVCVCVCAYACVCVCVCVCVFSGQDMRDSIQL